MWYDMTCSITFADACWWLWNDVMNSNLFARAASVVDRERTRIVDGYAIFHVYVGIMWLSFCTGIFGQTLKDTRTHAHRHTHRHAIQFSQRVWLICCPCNKSISISHKPDNICFFYYESQPGSWLVAGWKVYGWKVCARRVSGWRVSGWKVYGWKVCARRVSGWKVCAIRVSGWRVSGWKVCARRVSGRRVSGWKILGNIGIDGMLAFVPPSQVRFPIIGKQRSPFYMNYHMFSIQTWHV